MQQKPVKHAPITFYLRMLLSMFIALFLRMVAFAPLLCLLLFPAGSPWRYGALLCPVLLLFFILPLRFSYAEAIVQRPRERRFSFDTALSLSGYGEKLLESILHVLNVLKWGLPLAAMLGYGVYLFKSTDAFTLITMVPELGKSWTGTWCAVGNFFFELFGSANRLVVPANTLMDGVKVILGVLGVGVLILLYGAMRNSATRYIWVVANRADRSTRTEIRRRLRGRRLRQLGVALINLVLWTPFLVAIASMCRDLLTYVGAQGLGILYQEIDLSLYLEPVAGPFAAAFLLLYMTLLPARRWLTAAFATHDRRHVAPRTRQTQHAVPQQAVAPQQTAEPSMPEPVQEAPIEPQPEAPVQSESSFTIGE